MIPNFTRLSLIIGIINLKEKRGLRNIALVKETLTTHSGRERKRNNEK